MEKAVAEMDRVAPLAGAWIETFYCWNTRLFRIVAPLAGAWIETQYNRVPRLTGKVAPLAGAWIETLNGKGRR